ncbi:MAG TPA: hypothetical protein V6C58_01355 [Allocoleopsis sp.]
MITISKDIRDGNNPNKFWVDLKSSRLIAWYINGKLISVYAVRKWEFERLLGWGWRLQFNLFCKRPIDIMVGKLGFTVWTY